VKSREDFFVHKSCGELVQVTTAVRPTVLAAGYKGPLFVAGLLEAGINPHRIVTYRQPGDESGSFDRLMELGRDHGIDVEESWHPRIAEDRLVFMVGWQFLLRDTLDRCVVFHDSLLPQLRGYSPTVTALLVGSDAIGVTAFRPDDGIDTGPICGSRKIQIGPGESVDAVLERQTRAMVDLAVEVLNKAANGTLDWRPQDGDAATYSPWRDAFDYFIDWRRDASEVLRHVQAHGFPYEGAKGVLDDQVLTIVRASLGPNIEFAVRDPGKLWQIEGQRALVVCGGGTLWIEEARDTNGQPFHFKHLRRRFLTADTAWIAPFLGAQGPGA
jgi:methionyl-tRNA formyltransferase